MLQQLRSALVSVLLLTLLLGVAYPLAVTGIAQLFFPQQASGSLIRDGDRVIGSALIGQNFSRPEYLHPRPSVAGDGYDAGASSGSNLGPLNPDLARQERERAASVRAANPGVDAPVPADAATASASGLDPDISPAYAFYQVQRIAAARGAPAAAVGQIVADHVRPAFLGFIGQSRVNVLVTNLALDRRFPVRKPPGS
ncbi:MAG TPA: potassium-transporting ATPase subunit KdpC [Pseudolabrys sp.]|nr:potassium-transporting ATPase subunit KdpC [Pseudolabrys sp.]